MNNNIILMIGLGFFLSLGGFSENAPPAKPQIPPYKDLTPSRDVKTYEAQTRPREVASFIPKTCAPPCPVGFKDGGGFCVKPSIKFRGPGYPTEAACSAAKKTACEQCGMLWHQKCEEGYTAISCTICQPQCPADMDDHGICMKKLPAGCKI